MMTTIDIGERFYHTEKQANEIAESLSDEDWIAKVRHSGGMYAVNVYERESGELVKKNA